MHLAYSAITSIASAGLIAVSRSAKSTVTAFARLRQRGPSNFAAQFVRKQELVWVSKEKAHEASKPADHMSSSPVRFDSGRLPDGGLALRLPGKLNGRKPVALYPCLILLRPSVGAARCSRHPTNGAVLSFAKGMYVEKSPRSAAKIAA